MNSFEMFTRCSLMQWKGYKPKVRQLMNGNIESGWFAFSMNRDVPDDSRTYEIWRVIPPEYGKLNTNQSTLMKVIEE